MTLTYRARLGLEAAVPEEPSIEPFLKASVEFPVWCPKCGPNRNYLKKNGFDWNHSSHPQLFFCKRHKMHFYAHTSWICTQLSEIIFERIVSDLFEKRLSAKAVATRHQISPSLISQIRHHFTQTLEWKLQQLAQKREILQNHPNLPVPLEDAIYWDETFFRIGQASWALILLIDARGQPLVWKLSRTRTVRIYRELLQTIQAQLPSIPIFIGDGWSAYQKTCLELNQECFLIEHLHSQPWQVVRLHHFQGDRNARTRIQNSIEILYDSFIQNIQLTGYAIQRKHKFKDPNTLPKKRGRPLGCKDKEKRHSKHFPKPPISKPPLKKRGRKSIRKNGRAFQFHPTPFPNGWQLEWLSQPPKSAQVTTPPLVEIELLLDLTYKVMNGRSIQSNLIESKNRLIKDIIPRRGLKNLTQLKQYLNSYLTFWRNSNTTLKNRSSPLLPLKPSTGFARILTFFHPQIKEIQIRRNQENEKEKPSF